MKKKLLLLSTMAVMACSENVTAQKTVSQTKTNGLKKAVQLRPDVKKLIQQQIQNNTAQKTTAPELLIASYGYYNFGGTPDHDSTTYSYSGSRGSNLTDIFSYFDYFYPISNMSPHPQQSSISNLLFDTSYYFNGNTATSMTKQAMTNRTYDAANNITLQHDRSYNSTGVLDGHSYTTVGYDANNNIINATYHEDTSITVTGLFALTASMKANYAAGTSRRLNDTIENYWLSFTNRMFTDYTYDGNGKMTKALTQTYDPFTSTWENDYQVTYTYDGSGRLVTAVEENWDGSAWEIDVKDTFGYTGSAPIYTFYESTSYSSGIPFYSYRQLFILNASQSVDSIYSFDLDNGNWVPAARGKLTYNSNQHLTHYQETEYDEMSGTWNTTPSVIYRWHYAAANNIKDARNVQNNFVQLYPNPSVQNLNLKIENPQGLVAVNIYNLTGQLLQTFSQTASELVQINLTSLPAGSYMAEVIMNGNVQHSKFVKQ